MKISKYTLGSKFRAVRILSKFLLLPFLFIFWVVSFWFLLAYGAVDMIAKEWVPLIRDNTKAIREGIFK